MQKQIKQAIQEAGSFSKEELEVFEQKLSVKTFSKDALLLKKGAICRTLYFLNSGSIRRYNIVEDEEVILDLYTPGNWVLDSRSFVSQQPSKTIIRACERSQLMGLDIHSLHELIDYSPAFFALGRFLETRSGNRHPYHRIQSSEERYRRLLEESPQLVRIFPLKYIASYLGMRPETLSRIRHTLARP